MWQHYLKDYSKYSSYYTNIEFKIIYKPGPDLFISNWLSRQNNKEDQDEEIVGMQVNVNSVETTTNIPCLTIHELHHKMALDNTLQQLKECIIKGLPENKENMSQNLRPYWTF